jgi:hypothetical protein
MHRDCQNARLGRVAPKWLVDAEFLARQESAQAKLSSRLDRFPANDDGFTTL